MDKEDELSLLKNSDELAHERTVYDAPDIESAGIDDVAECDANPGARLRIESLSLTEPEMASPKKSGIIKPIEDHTPPPYADKTFKGLGIPLALTV